MASKMGSPSLSKKSSKSSKKRISSFTDPVVVVDNDSDHLDPHENATTYSAPYMNAQMLRKHLFSHSLIRSLSSYFFVVLLMILIFGVSWKMVWRLPKPLPNDSPNYIFAEGRAWQHLEQLQEIGPSLVGTKSNVAVSNYIENAMRTLQSEIETAKSAGILKLSPKIEIEVQRPSGALNFDLLGFTLTNHYTRLHNVIARVSWEQYFDEKEQKDLESHFKHSEASKLLEEDMKSSKESKNGQKRSQKSLLVNSHFDSGVSSPGAMDARACNAVMLELARSLSYAENPLPHPVIFLWNGAEESLQEGSHGFITQHRWRSEVGSVLNFDAGGIGGPQILFQVGSGEYAELFAKVAPRLHGSVLAQELFDTGLLQGDTDYRIFRDFGNVHGLDLAWYRDGYKYHTPRDDLNWVEEGSLQHAGDNSFAYISAICSHVPKGSIWRDQFLMQHEGIEKSDGAQKIGLSNTHDDDEGGDPSSSKGPSEIESQSSFVKSYDGDSSHLPDLLNSFPSRSQIIFYDFLGLFTIHYTKTMANVLNTLCAFAVLWIIFSNRRTLLLKQYANFQSAHSSNHQSSSHRTESIPISKSVASLLRSTTSIFAANILGLLALFVIAAFMTLTGKTMSWFANQYVIAFLYLPPVFVGWIVLQYWRTGKPLSGLFKLKFWNIMRYGYDKKAKKNSPSKWNEMRMKNDSSAMEGSKMGYRQNEKKSWQQLEYETVEGVALWSTGTMVLWSLMGIASAYFWLWLSLSSFVSLVLIRWRGLSLDKAVRMKESMVPVVGYLCFLPSSLLLFQTMIQIMALAFPLSGRLPPEVPVEFVTSSIFVVLMLNVITPLQPLIHRFRKYRVSFKLALMMVLVGVVIGMMTFPYTPYRPKRVTIQHAYRTSSMPGHDGLDSPAILFALCDAGPTGNMVSALKQLDSRGATPHRDVHDWDAVFPMSSFLYGYSLPSTAPPLRAPTATILEDQWDEKSHERRIVIEVDYAGSEWSTLKFMGPLSRWNLTQELPIPSMPSGYHIIRHIGEHGLTKWAVQLTFPDKSPRRFDITATHFAPTSATQIVTQTLPDWTAPLVLTTSMSHIDA